MDIKKVNDLAEKYWNAETSPEEEKWLFTTLLTHPEIKGHEELKLMASYVVHVGPEVQPIQSPQNTASNKVVVMRHSIKNYIPSIAAIFVLAIVAIFGVRSYLTPSPSPNYVEVTDPEEALEITKQALAMFSTELNRGQEQAAKSVQTINNSNIFK